MDVQIVVVGVRAHHLMGGSFANGYLENALNSAHKSSID